MAVDLKELLNQIEKNDTSEIENIISDLRLTFMVSRHKHIKDNISNEELDKIKNYIEEKYNNQDFHAAWAKEGAEALLRAIPVEKNRRFQTAFFKSKRTQETTQTDTSYFAKIPAEIIKEMIFHIKSKNSINNLSLANKKLNKVINELMPQLKLEHDIKVYALMDIDSNEKSVNLNSLFETSPLYICRSFKNLVKAHSSKWSYRLNCITGYAIFNVPSKFSSDTTKIEEGFYHHSLEYLQKNDLSLSNFITPQNLQGFFIIEDKRPKPGFFDTYKKYPNEIFISSTANENENNNAQNQSALLST